MKRLALLLLAALAGCDSGTPGGGDAGGRVLVVNQGNFSQGNGNVAAYDPEANVVDSTSMDALGSILQSVEVGPDGRLYVVANTGGRVDVFDPATRQRVAQLAVENPRYVAFVSEAKAYVTSQRYDRPSAVVVVNPQTGAPLRTVEVGGLAEGLAVVGDRAYVATGAFSATADVVVIDTRTDAVVDTIDVGCAPRLVLAGDGGDVLVTCAGDAPSGEQGLAGAPRSDDEVVVLDGATGAEERRIPTGAIGTAGPGQDAFFVPASGELYLARTDRTVRRVNTRTGAVALLGPFGPDPLGAVAYDAAAGRLYVAHVPGFAVGGYVTVHDRGGTELRRFSSGGVAPSHFAFLPGGD